MSFMFYTLILCGSLFNTQNSFLEPTQEVEFLGVILNSTDMTASVPPHRKPHIKEQRLMFLEGKYNLA